MASSRSSRSSANRMMLIGGLTLVAILAIAFWPSGSGGSGGSFELVAPDTVLTAAEGGPAATGAALLGDGKVTVPVAGEPTLVLFLAHWCPHCQREVPVVQQWMADGGLPDGVEIRTVATSIDPLRPNYGPDQWLESEGWEIPTVVDDGRIAEAFGLNGLPFWAAVDADGQIVATTSGEQTPADLDALAATVAP